MSTYLAFYTALFSLDQCKLNQRQASCLQEQLQINLSKGPAACKVCSVPPLVQARFYASNMRPYQGLLPSAPSQLRLPSRQTNSIQQL